MIFPKIYIGYIKKFLRKYDIEVTRSSYIVALIKKLDEARDLNFVLTMPNSARINILESMAKSKSQFRQDLFVLAELNFKKNGYFVEFGALDGVETSNTYLLEKEFLWTGILAEPAKCWDSSLRSNRTSSIYRDSPLSQVMTD